MLETFRRERTAKGLLRSAPLRKSRRGARALLVLLAGLAGGGTCRAERCARLIHAGHGYAVCTVDVRRDRLALFAADAAGRPLASFERLAQGLGAAGRVLAFAMNAGMYEADLSPVGLLIVGGALAHPATTAEGSGNFFLKPNGVFFFGADGVGIKETQAFLDAGLHPDFATQSGPLLLREGALHPRIEPEGTSLKIRNGVGVRDAHTAVFAISEEPVNFHAFATLFRDALGCRDALYLDGSVSALYAPALGRTGQRVPLGPMVGVTVPATVAAP